MNEPCSPVLVIVLGHPGSGKTTLAQQLAQRFRLPLICKDAIKESLFDSLGWQDREWSKRLGRATYELMYYFIERQIAAGRSSIIESNFSVAHATQRFRTLQSKYIFVPFQILCYANSDVLLQRFRQRWATGNRHPGHVDDQVTEMEITTTLKTPCTALGLDGTIVEIDTNDFDKIDYAKLYESLAQVLKPLPAPNQTR